MTPVGVFFICQNEDKCHFVNSTSTTHMFALTQLFRMLSNQSCREELFRAKTKDTVLRIIQKYTVQYKEEQSAF